MDRFDLSRAVRAPFQDSEWLTKSLLAIAWTLLIVTIPALVGAQVAYIRSVAQGDEKLPAWSDFGGKWLDGLMVSIAAFLYFLPVVALGAFALVPVVSVAVNDGDAGGAAAALASGGICLMGVAGIVYAALMSVFFSAAMTHYAMRSEFGAFFDFGGILGHVRDRSGYFVAWVYVILVSMVVSTISSVLTGATGGLGGLVMPAVSYLGAMVSAHVLGQWAAASYRS